MSRLIRPPVRRAPSMPALLEEPTMLSTAVLMEEQLRIDAPDLLGMPDVLEHGASEPFRYCLNTATLRTHRLTLPELVDVAVGAGFEAIEPWIDEIERFVESGGDLRDLRARIRDMGLTVEGAIGFFEWMVDDDTIREAGLLKARKAMSLLGELGGKRIAAPPFGAHAADCPTVDLHAAADRYRDLLRIGEQTGVIPQVEFWGAAKNLSRLSEATFIAIDSGHPDACLLADIYHLYRGGSAANGLRLLSPRLLPLIHVNDYPSIPPADITDADRVFPGDGVAPLKPILRDLRGIGFTGFLSLELFNPEHADWEPLVVARTGMEKLREVVQDSF